MQFAVKPKNGPINLWAKNYPIRNNCVTELSVGEVFLCLSKGASVALIQPNGVRVPLTLANYKETIEKSKIVNVNTQPKKVVPHAGKKPIKVNTDLNSNPDATSKVAEEKTKAEEEKAVVTEPEEATIIPNPVPTEAEKEDTVEEVEDTTETIEQTVTESEEDADTSEEEYAADVVEEVIETSEVTEDEESSTDDTIASSTYSKRKKKRNR